MIFPAINSLYRGIWLLSNYSNYIPNKIPIVVGSTSIFFHYDPMKSQNMAGYIPYIIFFPWYQHYIAMESL
jgi:hypothetical protein